MLKNKSSILILTLWTISFLSFILLILGYGIRQKLSLIKRLITRQSSFLLAEAGITRGITLIKEIAEKEQITLNDFSSTPIFFTSQNLFTTYRIIDEQAKININKVEPKILERLFILLGLDQKKSQEIAYSIVDWRDPDSELSLALGSAEDSFYRWLDYPYEAKDYDFEVLEELLLVKDVDQEVFEKIKNYLTIYGEGKININTAEAPVLVALGIDKELVEKIIDYRNGKDKIPLTSDDNYFKDEADILDKVSSFKKLDSTQIERLSLIIDKYLTTGSCILRIISFCEDKTNKKISHIEAVVDRKGKVISFRRVL